MAGTLERPKDVVGGVLIMVIGAGFFLFGRELSMGSSFRMGPGYFPTILSLLMFALGAVLTFLAWRHPPSEGGEPQTIPWRGLLLILGAAVLFGLALGPLGLAPVLFLTVLLTAWASRYASVKASLPLALGLTFFCTLLFVRVLGLPLPWRGPWLSAAYWSPPPGAEAPPAPASSAPAQ